MGIRQYGHTRLSTKVNEHLAVLLYNDSRSSEMIKMFDPTSERLFIYTRHLARVFFVPLDKNTRSPI